MPNHDRWASEQIAIAVAAGVTLANAQETVNWILANLPYGADLATWVFPPVQLEQQLNQASIVQDARRDWYGKANVSATYKRILDATTENGAR